MKQFKKYLKKVFIFDSSRHQDRWKQHSYILSCISYLVAFENITIVPQLMLDYGSVSIIIYVFISIIVGFPSIIFDLTVGQYSSMGPYHVFGAMCPLFNGLGLSIFIVSWFMSFCYNLAISQILLLAGSTFHQQMPWDSCDNLFNNADCFLEEDTTNCEYGYSSSDTMTGNIMYNQTCYTFMPNDKDRMLNKDCSEMSLVELTSNCTMPIADLKRLAANRQSSIYQFIMSYIQRYASNDVLNSHDYEIIVCTIVTSFSTFFLTFYGFRTLRKVNIVLIPLVFTLLLILTCRIISISQLGLGVEYFTRFKIENLFEKDLWKTASFTVLVKHFDGIGSLILISSYAKFNENILKCSIITTAANYVHIFLFLIFTSGIYGIYTWVYSVDDIKDVSFEMAVLPTAFNYMTPVNAWIFVFYFMQAIIIITSQVYQLECLLGALIESWQQLARWRILISFILTISLNTFSIYILFQLDFIWLPSACVLFQQNINLILSLYRSVVMYWIYGGENLLKNLELMNGRNRLHTVLLYWTYFIPVFVAIVACLSIFSPNKEKLENWPHVICTLALVACNIPIIVNAMWLVYRSYQLPEFVDLSFKERLKKLIKPTSRWTNLNVI